MLLTTQAVAANANYHNLDLSLLAFDPGIPADTSSHDELGIYPKVRQAEANYLPYVLRQVLVQTDQWGVVRVLPQADHSAELLISGRIIRSDGLALELALRAVDSSGLVWLDKTFQATANEQDYAAGRDLSEPLFSFLYEQFAAQLSARATELGAQYIERLGYISQLLHARKLVPGAFTDYLVKDEQGLWQLRRLPAQNDPMLMRTGRVQAHEYLFVDTVDEQYAELYNRMTPSYDLWRKFNREQTLFQDSHGAQLEQRDHGRRGSFEAMRGLYNAYKWSKIEEQELATLAQGFDNELAPTQVKLEGQLTVLEGTLEARYAEWQRILYDIFILENGAGDELPRE